MLIPTVSLDNVILNNEMLSLEERIQTFYIVDGFGKRLVIEYLVPLVDIQYLWHPTADGAVHLLNEWDEGMVFRLNQSMPVFSLLNQTNDSSFSLAINELVNELTVSIGVQEETASAKIKIEMIVPKKNYNLSLSVISGRELWSRVIQEQVAWLYQVNSLSLLPTPLECYEPVLSTWYIFHQHISSTLVYDESKKYQALGTNTVILDDGWQTDDHTRRYAFVGDWEVAKRKFPDFHQHVASVKELGMSYLVWLSLPYLGNKSKMWSELQEDLLYFDEFQRAGILDIRKESIQAHLLEMFDRLMKDYEVDGFKIDFIEMFSNHENFYDIGLSLLLFLEKLTTCLKLEQNKMVEFRQDYINPLMMQFCNIVRAKDCPNNYYLNRVRTTDLRLSCPYTAIHSDMIMWNKKETIEDAALHIINVLFSVPQLSMRYDELTDEEIKMIRFWLSFMKEYRNVLLKSSFEPLNVHEGYSVIHAFDNETKVTGVYSENRIVQLSNEGHKQHIFVNGTKESRLVIEMIPGKYVFKTVSCTGVEHMCNDILIQEYQLLELSVPRSGILMIDVGDSNEK